MNKYKRFIEIDYNRFKLEDLELDVLYGLPKKVEFCKKCVISNQRPNSCQEFKHNKNSKKKTIHFDENGICDACRANEIKHNQIDWNLREKELIELCNKYRRDDGKYDCLVPGSGGKDSFYAAHILKYKYGMHPLTVTWAPHMYTEWGYENFQSWIHAGFDNYLVTPNGIVHRLLTRLAVENLFHPFQPFIIGQKQVAAKLAEKFDIPLIFYGENEAEYGNPVKDNDSALRSNNYFTVKDYSDVQLGGVSVKELIEEFKVQPYDLDIYMPANQEAIEEKNIKVHYLGYYLKWHPQEAYYYSVENGGFKPSPERTPGTYSKYNSIDDRIDDIHYYTTYIKFGIGRATYDAAQEIRNHEIDREEGIALVKKYDGEFPTRFEKDIYRYLSLDEQHFPNAKGWFEEPIMDRKYFLHLADRFRSPHIWKYDNGEWKIRKTIYE
jgi:N-acetyl sugar amidotransferase